MYAKPCLSHTLTHNIITYPQKKKHSLQARLEEKQEQQASEKEF